MSDGDFKKREYPMPKMPKGKKVDPAQKRKMALARYDVRQAKAEERERRIAHRQHQARERQLETAKERAERVNKVALDRIARIRKAPTALGIKMLRGIIVNQGEPFTDQVRTLAADALMEIGLGPVERKRHVKGEFIK